MDRKESDALYSRPLHRKNDLEGLYIELKSKNASARVAAAKEMRVYLEQKCQDLTPEAFDDLSERILSLIGSADMHEKLGGILAIEEIAFFLSGANQTQIFRFIHYLRQVFKGENMENDILLTHVARALGQLAKAGGGLAASIVDFEANQALQWLSGEHSDSRRHAGVLIFKELAESTPALCSNYVDPFLELIWLPLSHQNVGIRYATSRALRACLEVVAKRQAESRLITYTKLYKEAYKALKSESVDVVHAGLLCMGELFRNSGDFLRPQYRDVCETILKFRDYRNRAIRETVVSLIPSLAGYSLEDFVTNYLPSCLDFVINTLQGGHARPTAYLALGQLVLTVGRQNVQQSGMMELMLQLVRAGLGIHRNTPNHVLSAIALLAEAFGSRLSPFIPELLDEMFVGPLTSELVDALTKVAWNIPSSTILIQNRLLVIIQDILKVTDVEIGGLAPSPSGSNLVSIPLGDPHDIEQEVLALRILGDFHFENHNLLPFAREVVLAYTSHTHGTVQKQAVLTCCCLLRRHLSLQPHAKEFRRSRANLLELDQRDFFGGKQSNHQHTYNNSHNYSRPSTPLQVSSEFLSPSATPFFTFSTSPTFLSPPTQSVVGQPPPALTLGPPAVRSPSRPNLASLDEEDLILSEAVAVMQNCEKQLMASVLERLLTLGISDPNSGVRLTVFSSLESHFDPFLAQPENVRSLSIALNDEAFAVRETALKIMGRLSTRNPCVVTLCLRKTLIQLLTELQYGGTNRIESAKLLTYLITSSPRLIKLYTEPILKVLVPRLTDSENVVASLCLSVCGSLATVSGDDPVFRRHSEAIVRVIMNALCDERSVVKREVALRALSQVLESTGMDSVILERQGILKLLPMVLSSLTPTQPWAVRREAMKLLGTIGAIDPFQHQIYQLRREEKTDSSATTMRAASATVGQVLGPGAGTPQAHSSAGGGGAANSSTNSGDSANMVAISALMRILRDPLQRQHHEKVIEATVFVIKSLGSQSVPFLPIVLPQFIASLRAQEDLRATLFTQLTAFVSLVKAQIRPYLSVIFQVVSEFWSDESLLLHQILLVVETTAALGDDTATYMPSLLPQLIRVLTIDSNTKVSLKILDLLQCYGANLEPYLHMVVPALVRLLEAEDADMNVRIRAVHTLGSLSRVLRLSDYASRLIHPLARILESTDYSSQSKLRREVLETLAILKHQLQDSFGIFVPMMSKVLARASGDDTAIVDRYQSQDINDLPPLSTTEPIEPEPTETKKLGLNQENLRRVWDASQRTVAEDWHGWLRGLMIELLKESPAPALRACSMLAHECGPLAAVLFHAAFASCWVQLQDQFQDDLVTNIDLAFSSSQVPPAVLQTLLNLTEYMEQIDQPLPLDIRRLGAVAEKCHAYAKALYYKELEFQHSPETTTESLISINNQLGQPEAAIGVLTYTKHNHQTQIKASWFEKLLRWEDALEAYERKQLEDPLSLDITLGRMRCLLALGHWPRALNLSKQLWGNPEVSEDPDIRQAVAVLACHACWNLGRWEILGDYLAAINPDSSERHFFQAVLAIRQYNFNQARTEIMRTRQLIDSPLVALVGESYTRAYRLVVQVQQLAEMEELISFKTCEQGDRQALTRKMWTTRLQSCQRNVDVWLPILAVRSLVVDPHEDIPTWLKFASLCRRSGRQALALSILKNLFGFNPRNLSSWPKVLRGYLPYVSYAYVKHLWAIDSRSQANNRLGMLVRCIDDESKADAEFSKFKAKCYLKMGLYALEGEHAPKPEMITQVLSWFQIATTLDQTSYKAWHAWAVMNFRVVVSTKQQAENLKRKSRQKRSFRNAEDLTRLEAKINAHVVPAVTGFFHSIQLGGDKSLQDILRLLSLWFAHGEQPEVEEALVRGFNSLSLDTWLPVLPQIIARIDTSHHTVRRTIHDLLCRIGKLHPQALILIVTVAAKSETVNRKVAASEVLANMREHSPVLVEQAMTVGDELIRVAILWHEMWHEALEEASRQWYTHHNVEGMMAALTPLHELMSRGPQSSKEVAFHQDYARSLKEARDWCRKYARSNNERDMAQAWDLYSAVFRQIDRQLSTAEMLSVSLADVSVKLYKARDLLLAVPGTYLDEHDQNQARTREITIASFVSEVTIIESKQRPRKLSIIGIDGLKYTFLLKGHEDLRQDKRIMQLFGLVNTLLANNRATSTQDLRIRGYAVIPLSPNSGLIQWLPSCDTMHAMVKEYRDQCHILLNIELRLMLRMSANYQTLTTMQKVEVLEGAMACTTGQDLARMLWLKSQSSESWLLRRNNYTRSLAIMSMVGYVLGLGDRHPCNLMIDRHSGKIIHIDFGDCFEVAMHREKFPEKIPFRLTRMLVNAMEVSGIEGNFRIVAESVMTVLRQNGQSVMAVLEAFVYDPLVSWRLLTAKPKPKPSLGEEKELPDLGTKPEAYYALPTTETDSEVLNTKALEVLARVENKLRGRDFQNEELDVPSQVEQLVRQATSLVNLCQCYIGWCPFW